MRRRRRRHRSSSVCLPCSLPPTQCRLCQCWWRPTMADLLATTPTRPSASVQLPALGPALPLAGSGIRTQSSVCSPGAPAYVSSCSAGFRPLAAGVSAREQGSKSAQLELGDLPGPTRKPLVPWIAAERHSAPRSKPSRRFWPLQSASESDKNGARHAGNGPQPGLGWCAAPQLS